MKNELIKIVFLTKEIIRHEFRIIVVERDREKDCYDWRENLSHHQQKLRQNEEELQNLLRVTPLTAEQRQLIQKLRTLLNQDARYSLLPLGQQLANPAGSGLSKEICSIQNALLD